MFYNSYIGSIETSERNKWGDMNQDAANNTKRNIRTQDTHRVKARVSLSFDTSENWKSVTKKVNTDKEQETHKLCVQFLSHTHTHQGRKSI